MHVLGINKGITFTRRPTKDEEPRIHAACNQAYDVIGAKERAVITHGSCFPAIGRDTLIGSPFGSAAKEYIKFLSIYGFNSNQLGPCGELQKGSNSPYNSSAFAKNRLFIDLQPLTTEKYGKILSEKTFENVTRIPSISDKNYDKTDFKEAEHSYDIAMKESYTKFRANLINGHPQAIALNSEYVDFKNKHGVRLNDEAVFKILSREYGTENFDKWNNELDENLISEYEKGNEEAFERYKNLSVENSAEIEQYKFEQFVATKQIKENKAWRDSIGFKYINDLLVGCSKMDEWRSKEAFLKDWEMGARENYAPSQRWHIPVLDPKKLFLNDKYELNIGGKFLKEKIEFALEFCENIRVDHVMGLIEPYLMSKHANDYDFDIKPYSQKNKDIEKYISELKEPENASKEYDEFWDYPKLIEHIVLPVFKEHGIDKDLPMWEDICSYPDRFKMVYSKLDLPRISFLDWERAEEANQNNPNGWFILGNHDNIPAMNYLSRKGALNDEYTRHQSAWNPLYLAGYLNQDHIKRADERNEYCDKIANNDRELVYAKFAELMTTPKFQISFADLFGITDVTYNIPGTTREENWKERLTADFLDKYYENLASENPTALNIPEILKQALQAKIDMLVMQSDDTDSKRAELYNKYTPLLDELQKFADILKE